MALHPNFPKNPHQVLDPGIRWFPADEALRETSSAKLLPPLVTDLRKRVKEWRDSDYQGASATSSALLKWWFQVEHVKTSFHGEQSRFQYFFAQREALETIIYLYEIAKAKDKYDLIRFDSSGYVTSSMFDENWKRYVVKMATGSGKTKVLSLVLAWSYFHRLYEEESQLARNFLVIAPNIIVLDRIRKDFDGLRIFLQDDPVIPDNGFAGRDWKQDFQLSLHVQDDVHITRKTGNIFLTNIHRVYSGNDSIPTPDDADTRDYFLGRKPTGATTDSRVDLSVIVREIDELMVLNDEAHHIHDSKLAWFKSIEDIHNRMLQKGSGISMQIDVTATPKHSNGAIFVQTVADYPLVEAISQNVVKHPVLPDAASRAKLVEKKSAKFTERYSDYINLGVTEWRSAFDEHQKMGKKAVIFIMTDDTKTSDEVAEYLELTYPEFKGAVLVIHTKNNGEITESSSGKSADELDLLRRQANEIDESTSPYKAIVSVMVLKEGWDVRNVTTIVGLRAYSAQSNILPEQTLGRGLRKMYGSEVEEYVSVVGTNAFMDFVESIQAEGIVLERREMGPGTSPKTPLVIEVDKENLKKDLDNLDIEIPVLTNRIFREYKNLSLLQPSQFTHKKLPLRKFSAEQIREIVFKDITTGEITHTTLLDIESVTDFRSVIGYFAQSIMKDLRLITGYDVLYPLVKEFISQYLFESPVDVSDGNVLRNLSEVEATRTVIETFKRAINELTVQDRGEALIRDHIKLRQVRPFVVQDQPYIVPKKSVFNRIVGDSHLELVFANFLESCEDVVAYAKNYYAVNFKLDYINADGDVSHYIPDFIVKDSQGDILIIETKGPEDLDDTLKLLRLKTWCEDMNGLSNQVHYDYCFVDQESFEKYRPTSLHQLVEMFRRFKD